MTRWLLAAAIVVVGLVPGAEAVLDVTDYSSLERLEADLDTAFQAVEAKITAAGEGPIDRIGLAHLSQLVMARHDDFLFFIDQGQPKSREEIDVYAAVDMVVSKYDDRLLELLVTHRDRFRDEDRAEADLLVDVLTTPYGGMIRVVSPPDPEALEGEALAAQEREYLDFLVQQAIYLRDYDEALRVLESEEMQAHIQDPGDHLMLIGAVHHVREDYEQAVSAFERALPSLPNDRSGLWDMGTKQHHLARTIAQIYDERLEDDESTERFFDMAYTGHGDTAEFLYSYAWFLLDKRGDVGSARPLIERALALSPDDAYIQDAFGYLLLLEGRGDEAAEYFRKALASDALDPGAAAVIQDHLRQAEQPAQEALSPESE